MIPFLRRLSAVTRHPSALVIRRGAIALGGGACVAVCALVLGRAAQPHLHPLVAVADTRPTIIDGPPTNVEAAPPPVTPAPRLRRPRTDPSLDEDADDYEDASAAAPDQAEPPPAPQAQWQGSWQGSWQGQDQRQAEPPRSEAQAPQTQGAWPYRCAGYSSAADRMICAFPRLNADEVALQRVYGMALYRTDNPEALREEQRRWRAVRDQVAEAEGPQGLAEFYAERIQELDGGGYY